VRSGSGTAAARAGRREARGELGLRPQEAMVPVPLGPDERALFAAAARVLLETESHPPWRDGGAGSGPQGEALRALWLRTGGAPQAPAPMPEQPLAPGLPAILWRRLRAAMRFTCGE